MLARPGSATPWDGRIARARELAAGSTPARETLSFYAELAGFQRSLFLAAADAPAVDGDFLQAVDVDAAAAAVPRFLAWLERAAPRTLALAAASMAEDTIDWRTVLRASLAPEDEEDQHAAAAGPFGEATPFVVEAVLQPFAEAAAIARRERLDRPSGPVDTFSSRCPICASRPSVGILREEGQGAKRLLACARCLTEWPYLRVLCTSCGEEKFEALPVFTTELFAHIRLEACDTCRRYLKTIDLTVNGLAVPVVDDIASVPLDLWAGEQGYRRVRPNLLRTAEPASGTPLPPVL